MKKYDGSGKLIDEVVAGGVIPGVVTATIANGASISGAVDISGEAVVGIIMPSEWTAANLTFQVSADGGTTFFNLYDGSGNEVLVIASTDRYIRLPPSDWVGMTHVKVRSGTAGTPVNQGAARSVKLITRAV